ncbi:MAG: type II toxin-antitoxin system VapC family toxin [Verrucomicrobiae bacterium]|nr:type II toxin-antitoxin system VapC family toxin [Verrucomicrobiae bacterium]
MLNLPKRVAVDTNVALDLGAEVEVVCDAIDTIRARVAGVELVLPPTVLVELAYAAEQVSSPTLRATARRALREHQRFGFRLVNYVSPGREAVARIAARIRAKGLLPAQEVHDSLILVESAALSCGLLMTGDRELRAVDFQRLVLELGAFDLVAPVIATPREIVREFFR